MLPADKSAAAFCTFQWLQVSTGSRDHTLQPFPENLDHYIINQQLHDFRRDGIEELV